MTQTDLDKQRALSQYPTPQWVASAIIDKYFDDLSGNDVVLEPSCGPGAFLAAVPAHVTAFGVEIDPALAKRAREATGRAVICGDFRSIELPLSPTVVVGNPPFRLNIFIEMMDRVHSLLPDEAKAGFILPAYMLQTPSKVARLSRQWSMTSELLPRSIWPRLAHPLVFCMFRKGGERTLIGFTLFTEVQDMGTLRAEYRELLTQVSRSAWATALVEVLANLGGRADLETIYRAMEPKRPTGNRWWKEKIRQVAQKPPFERIDRGQYALPELKAA